MSPFLRGIVWRLRDAERRLANRARRNRDGMLAKMTASQMFALSADAVRRGLAVGLFWAMAPMPFQMAPATLFCWLARGNLPLALVCVWISNPLTYAPIFLVEFQVGKWLLNDGSVFVIPKNLGDILHVGGITLLVGALACGILASIVGYALGGPFAMFLQDLRRRRIALLQKRRAARDAKAARAASR